MIKNFGNVLDIRLDLDSGERSNFLQDFFGDRSVGFEDFEGISGLLPGESVERLSEVFREIGKQGDIVSWRSISLTRSQRLDLPLVRSASPEKFEYVPGSFDAPVLGVREGDYSVLTTLDFSPDGSNIGSLWESSMTLKAILKAGNLSEENPASEPLFERFSEIEIQSLQKSFNALKGLHKKVTGLYDYLRVPVSLSEELGLVPTMLGESLEGESDFLVGSVEVGKFLGGECRILGVAGNEEIDFSNVFAGFVDSLSLACVWGPPSLLGLDCYSVGDASENWLLDAGDFAFDRGSSLVFPDNLDRLDAFRKVEESEGGDEVELALREAIANILASSGAVESGRSFDGDVVVSQFLSREGDYRSSAVYLETLSAAQFLRFCRDGVAGGEGLELGLEGKSLLIKRLLSFWSSLVRNSALAFGENRDKLPSDLAFVFEERSKPFGFVQSFLGEPLGPPSSGDFHSRSRLRGLVDFTPETSPRRLLFVDAFGRLFLPFSGEGETDEFLRRAVSDSEIEFQSAKAWLEDREEVVENSVNFLGGLSSFSDVFDILSPFSEVVVNQINNLVIAANGLSEKKVQLRELLVDEEDLERRIALKESRISAWETPEVLRERLREREEQRASLVEGFIEFWEEKFSGYVLRRQVLSSFVLEPLFVVEDFQENGALSESTNKVDKANIETKFQRFWETSLQGDPAWGRENLRFNAPVNQSSSRVFSGPSSSAPSINPNLGESLGPTFSGPQNEFIFRVREAIRRFNEIVRIDLILDVERSQLERDLVRAEERLPGLEALNELRDDLLEEAQLLRLARAEKAQNIAQSQTALVTHQMLLDAFSAIERGDTAYFASLSALSFARWLNIDNKLPTKYGFETENNIAEVIERNIRQRAEIKFTNGFELLLKNENFTPNNFFHSAFSPEFVKGNSEVKPIEFIANELVGPIFETLYELHALDEGEEFTAGTTRWLGLSQPFLWSFVLYTLSTEFSYLQNRTNNKLGRDERETNLQFVREVGSGNRSRFALKFVPEKVYELLTCKAELEYSYVRKVARSQKNFFAHSIQFLELLFQRTKERMTNFTEYLDAIEDIEIEEDEFEEAMSEARSEKEILAVMWKFFGNGRAAFSRQDILGKQVFLKELLQRRETQTPERTNREENFLSKQDTFLLRRKIIDINDQTNVENEGVKIFYNKHEHSVLIQTLRLLLIQNGFGDPLDNDGFIDTDKIIALGTQRTNKPWINSPIADIQLRWKSLLNNSSFQKNFVFDTGIWANPKIENYAYLTLPTSEINKVSSEIIQEWWEFWMIINGEVELLDYKQTLSVLRENNVDDEVVNNLLISEHLKLLVKMIWNLDLRDQVWFDQISEERFINQAFGSTAFSRIYLLPWSKDYVRRSVLDVPRSIKEGVQTLFSISDDDLDEVIVKQELLSEVTAGEIDLRSRDFVYSGLSTWRSEVDDE